MSRQACLGLWSPERVSFLFISPQHLDQGLIPSGFYCIFGEIKVGTELNTLKNNLKEMVPSAGVFLCTKWQCPCICRMGERELGTRRRKPDESNSFNLLPYLQVAENILFSTLSSLSTFFFFKSSWFPPIFKQFPRAIGKKMEGRVWVLGDGMGENRSFPEPSQGDDSSRGLWTSTQDA